MTSWTPERPCPIPGHPQDGFPGDGQGFVAESLPHRLANWHRDAPAERLPLPAFLATWPASWAMHALHVPATYPGCTTCALTAVAALTWWRHRKNSPHPRLAPLEAAAVTAAIGGWVTAAAASGPLGWPFHLLSLMYVAGWAAGYWWLRQHEAVLAARKRRDALAADIALKRLWHQVLPQVGLGGWHLQERWATNLGYEVLLTGSPENDQATRIARHSAAISEKLEHYLGLPYNRVEISLTEYPGELIVGVRTVDVSVRKAGYHPMTLPWPEEEPSPFAGWFPEVASIRDPATWGFTPENGAPLAAQLLSEIGGRVVGVIGMTGSGKSNLLNNLREFVSRCPDARLVQLNGAHMGDELTWKPLSALTLCGPVATNEKVCNDIAEALQALCLLVTNRSATLAATGHSTFQPTPEDPAVVIFIDEVDEIVKHVPGAGMALEFLASKQRKSAVCLVLATQRATVSALGGGAVRANMGEVLVGKVARATESRHATGAEAEIPDIREYAKGEPGYFQIWDPHSATVKGRGRALLLGKPPEELAYIGRLVAARRHLRNWGIHDMPPLALDGGESAAEAAASAATSHIDSLRARLAGITGTAAQPAAEPAAQVREPAPAPDTVPIGIQLAMLGIPQRDLETLLPLLDRPEGVTSAAAGQALGKSKSRAHEFLQLLDVHGIAVRSGVGRASRYRLARRAQAAPADKAQTSGHAPDHPEGYVTIADLADAVARGETEVDDDTRQVLSKVRHLTVVKDPESDAS